MKKRKSRKNGSYSINVSFCEYEADLLEYADKQGSFTSYVKKLIDEDMESRTSQNFSGLAKTTEILKLLQIALNQQPPAEALVDKEEKQEMDENAINDLLNMD